VLRAVTVIEGEAPDSRGSCSGAVMRSVNASRACRPGCARPATLSPGRSTSL